MNKRQEERYPTQLPIAYAGDLVEGQGTVMNLSFSGCGVRTTSKKVLAGAYVHLVLQLPQKRDRLKVELAKVRWAHGDAFGLEFIRINTDHHTRLHEYLDSLRVGSRRAAGAWSR